MAKRKKWINEIGNVALIDLESNHCRWPCGNPGDYENFMFCGREVVPTTSWCIKHLPRVTPQAKRVISRELKKEMIRYAKQRQAEVV